ncbi:MAG: FG-GAP-like repeat-containing protein, partial [Chloroflexota bacterium]
MGKLPGLPATLGAEAKPIWADIDNDNDADLIVGLENGHMRYFENTANTQNLLDSAAFTERTNTNNPFNDIDVGIGAAPALIDLDNDGDLDTVVGERNGTLHYFENAGNNTSPSYTERADTDNPFNGIDVGYAAAPSLADLDNDNDLDLVVGERHGALHYFENTGNATAPAFIQRVNRDNPFNGVDVGYASTPNLIDLNVDGTLEALVGDFAGKLHYFEKTT